MNMLNPILTVDDYEKAVEYAKELNEQIVAFKNNCLRGRVQITAAKCGYKRERYGFSVRYNMNENGMKPYWKTIQSFETLESALNFCRIIGRDMQALSEAYKKEDTHDDL